ncbi:MAG: tyrosine-type recombinase/integrase [Pseudomonadales bacterium]|nr:tyrosine-type recombinase/integrase [Pseudomonadales bacterium]
MWIHVHLFFKDFSWQYVFPSTTRCTHPYDGYICRHHLHPTAFTKQLRLAVVKSGIHKRVTAHTFRHSFATQLLAFPILVQHPPAIRCAELILHKQLAQQTR